VRQDHQGTGEGTKPFQNGGEEWSMIEEETGQYCQPGREIMGKRSKMETILSVYIDR
jgi:hypothetical protein